MGKGVWIAFIVIVLVLISGFFIMKNYSQKLEQNLNSGISQGTIAEGAGGAEPETQNILNNTQVFGDSSAPQTYNIEIKNSAFVLRNISIKVGDIIIWTNKDSTTHTVTSDSGNELASLHLSQGQTYFHTFTTAGSFAYHCALHTGMKGTVVVE
jgi:plastocyanin